MKYFVCVLFLFRSCFLNAQDYRETILKYREHYIQELLTEPRQPVRSGDARYINFYETDARYCIWAAFTVTPGSKPFMMATHSGKDKPFREYGFLDFSIGDTVLKLHVYQGIDMLNDMAHKDDLFIPFNDYTNYETTFGGGRYIDINTKDIVNGSVLLDFNKCYNPYCAYGGGFSCPIPPDENHLRIEIRAGERQFEKFLAR